MLSALRKEVEKLQDRCRSRHISPNVFELSFIEEERNEKSTG